VRRLLRGALLLATLFGGPAAQADGQLPEPTLKLTSSAAASSPASAADRSPGLDLSPWIRMGRLALLVPGTDDPELLACLAADRQIRLPVDAATALNERDADTLRQKSEQCATATAPADAVTALDGTRGVVSGLRSSYIHRLLQLSGLQPALDACQPAGLVSQQLRRCLSEKVGRALTDDEWRAIALMRPRQ